MVAESIFGVTDKNKSLGKSNEVEKKLLKSIPNKQPSDYQPTPNNNSNTDSDSSKQQKIKL